MNLKQNPFVLLELSSREDKATIAEQYEEKVSDGELDERELMIAQKNLMTSKNRLKAEISWLPNLNPKKAAEIANLVRDTDNKALKKALPTLDGLSRANVASYLLAEKQGTKEVLSHLFDAQSQFDITTILNDVNDNRSLAGFPAVDMTLIEGSISMINSIYAEAVMTYISAAKHPGNIFTGIVEKYIDNPKIASFIDDVAEKYDSWVITKLRDYEDQIKDLIEKMKLGASADDSIEKITELLKDWDKYSQPLQLIYQAKGLDEKRSKDLYLDMRDIYVWLANENNNHELSLKFSQSLCEIFPELPSVVVQIEDDIQSLEDLVEEAKKDKDLTRLIEKFAEVMKDEEGFCKSVMKGNFRSNGSGLAGEFYQEFIAAVKNTKDKEHEDSPWLIVRKLAIYLNNETGKPKAAEKVLLAMENALPPNSVKDVLTLDTETIKENNKKETELKVLKPVIHIVSIVPFIGETVANILTWSAQKFGSIKMLISFALVVLSLIVWANQDSGHSYSSQSHSSKSYNSSSNYGSTTDSHSQRETKPPVNTNQVHNRSEIRYCQFQGERLSYIQNQFPTSEYDQNTRRIANAMLLTDAVVNKYDELVADYNSRCGSYRYQENDLSAVKRELSSMGADLKKDAQRIMNAWEANFKFE